MSKVGLAACSTLTLGCICRGGAPAGCGCTGGGPLGLPTGRVVSSYSGPARSGAAVDGGRGARALTSFLGGVGAWSADMDEAAGVTSAPSGPRGSREPSTASSFVGWTSTLRAGILRDDDGRGPPAGFVGVEVPGPMSAVHRHPRLRKHTRSVVWFGRAGRRFCRIVRLRVRRDICKVISTRWSGGRTLAHRPTASRYPFSVVARVRGWVEWAVDGMGRRGLPALMGCGGTGPKCSESPMCLALAVRLRSASPKGPILGDEFIGAMYGG